MTGHTVISYEIRLEHLHRLSTAIIVVQCNPDCLSYTQHLYDRPAFMVSLAVVYGSENSEYGVDPSHTDGISISTTS